MKKFAPVLLTVGLLVYVGGFARLNIATEGVDDFRKRAASAIEALPLEVGPWKAQRKELDSRARDLLQPNAENSLLFKDSRTGNEAHYSVIQVKDSRHMTGHAPANCYPGNGFTITREEDRTIRVGEGASATDIKARVYHLKRDDPMGARLWCVYSFFIFPDGTLGSTLKELDRAAEDYRKLAYGVAQVQLLTGNPRLTDKQRDEIFSTLVGSERSLEMVRILRTGIPE